MPDVQSKGIVNNNMQYVYIGCKYIATPQPTTDFEKQCNELRPMHNQKGLQTIICNTYTSDANIRWLGSSSPTMVEQHRQWERLRLGHDSALKPNGPPYRSPERLFSNAATTTVLYHCMLPLRLFFFFCHPVCYLLRSSFLSPS